MKQELLKLTKQLILELHNDYISQTDVIPWASPVISFGRVSSSAIATLGLNPSNREFVDPQGKELVNEQRRFQTLRSLEIEQWNQSKDWHIESVLDSCERYFSANPYDTWFKSLDKIIYGTGHSYYHPMFEACHLDLVPFATYRKWGEISKSQRDLLLERCGFALGKLVRISGIKLLILNGKSVVDHFRQVSDVEFLEKAMPEWELPRSSGAHVKGISYIGNVSSIGGVSLNKGVGVLGFNHNIQSSYGVTTCVRSSITKWIAKQVHKFDL